jgi:hypothetical protein
VRRRTILLYWADHTPTVRVTISSSGITWAQTVPGSLIGATVDYSPTAEDWHNFAFAMARDVDAIEREAEDLLTQMQDQPEAHGAHVEALASLNGSLQCVDCSRWEAELAGEGRCERCYDALVEEARSACRCAQPNCGDCGRDNAHKPL